MQHPNVCPSRNLPRRIFYGAGRCGLAIILLLLCLLPPSCWEVLAKVDDATLTALEDLYFATAGPRWVYPANTSATAKWTFPVGSGSDPCADSWSGLSCSHLGSACTDSVQCIVQKLNLTAYGLNGTLPPSIGDLVNVTSMILEKNMLHGSFNFETLYPLTQLKDLRVNENSLSGSLPSDVDRLGGSLGLLKLRSNRFFGSIPPALGDLSKLYEVHLSLNSFSGTIPTAFQKLSSTLTYLSIRNNAVTGTIPSELGSLSKLKQLSMYSNSIAGTIPPSLGNLTRINLLVLHTNCLTGTIPPELGQLRSMGGLYLHRNCLGGTIPSQLYQLTSLNDFDLSANNLHGSLPEHIGTMSAIRQFRVRQNKLTGTIPGGIQFWKNLTEFDISSNIIVGTLPSFLAEAQRLQILNVRSNHLDGPLLTLNQMKDFPSLESIDVSSNHFTGGLPEELFQSSSLKFFDASQNCLDAKIGDFLCAGHIESVSLNGLSSADVCRVKLDDKLNIFKATITEPTRGTVPKCLLEKPSVIQVYMAGNRLQGDLEGVVVGSNLTELGLGSNELKGPIPRSILLHPFRFLDLSYNKLEGDLGAVDESCALSAPEANMTRHLSVNRLSNMVPKCYNDLSDIDIVAGNHFNCNDEYKLPSEDASSDATICGSQDFDLSLIFYLCLSAVGAGFIFWYMRRIDAFNRVFLEVKAFLTSRSEWLSLMDIEAPGLRNFGGTIHGILEISVALGIYIIIACAVLSAGLSASYYLITNSYGWKLSMVMLIGWPVSLGYALFWCSIMIIFLCASLLQLVRWQEGVDLGGRFVSFDSLLERYGESITSNPVHTDSGDSFEGIKAAAAVFDSGKSDHLRPSAFRPSDLSSNDGRETFGRSTRVLTFNKPDITSRQTDTSRKTFFDMSERETKVVESLYVYKTETVNHEEMQINSSIIGKSVIVLIINIAVSVFLNALYSIVLSSNMDVANKLLFQFAFAAATTAWNKGGVGFSIKKVGTSFRLQVLLNIAMNVINTIIVPCLTMMVTSDYCFYGLFEGLGDITVVVNYDECKITSFSNGNVVCTERGPAVSINTFSRPFVYNGGCSQAIIAAYIPVFIFSYAIDLVLSPIAFAVIAKYFEGVDAIPVPHMLWLSSRTRGYQLLRGHQLFIIIFQHILVLLTFGIASPVLALVIVVGVVADAILYVYMVRRFLENVKTRSDDADPTGGLEAASRMIPRNFLHIYLCIMWVSAFFYSAVLLDYAIDGSFIYDYISIPVVILSVAVILTAISRHPRRLFYMAMEFRRSTKSRSTNSSILSLRPSSNVGTKSSRSQPESTTSNNAEDTLSEL